MKSVWDEIATGPYLDDWRSLVFFLKERNQVRYKLRFPGCEMSWSASMARTDAKLADILEEMVNMLRAERVPAGEL